MMRDADKFTNLELVARLYDSAEALREHNHRSVLADWCEEAALRLRCVEGLAPYTAKRLLKNAVLRTRV